MGYGADSSQVLWTLTENTMKVFVTGEPGYIGSIMSELLLNRDHAVVVIDNLS